MILDTIVGISTAQAMGAIGIVRLSGDEAITIANQLFNKDLNKIESHTVTYGRILDPSNHEMVDEVMLTMFKAPRSYTKEDIVEISCHGGLMSTSRVLGLCVSLGARLAQPGEFTQRAVINGRIDLTQAEGINDLINASSTQAMTMALKAMSGDVKKIIEPLIDELIGMIAHIEVNIDYPEYEDVVQMTTQEILPQAKSWVEKADALIEASMKKEVIKEGVKTVIVGQPNVGKSSLLNALLQEEKAIVTPIAGTTRDFVEGYIRLKHIPLHLIDTAGIRESDDVVEKIGIDRSLKSIDSAELVIVVIDPTNPNKAVDEQLIEKASSKKHIVVYNKSDLIKSEGLSISALNQDIQPLIDHIETLFAKNIAVLDTPTLSNQRQIGLLTQAKRHLLQAIDAIEAGFEVDLITIDLSAAYDALTSILSANTKPSLMDEIFSRFCLGK
ncbi:MAG: tRNA uridine-5-carboxymethylaminomethyl(34) synthesis GTPase MnmE [Erysipelotrichaceae bacterium]|nr:tRNA uridine-5-carboxymethylaminomethyl(34) synthesis GTPase MnmE [Erysipelotrichaceae bacterium]MCD8574350.1 tRNA uridine-5-carboxymethylaminomethyl(34) synthesis GTPase MnmE [Erysipelotrichaceae bacterium]